MATISFPIPSNLAGFLSSNFPGLANASENGGVLNLNVPDFANRGLPAPVVAGLNEAGFQPPANVVDAGAPVADAENVQIGLAQFAPEGLVPQGPALDDANLAGAVSFAQNISQAASNYFQQAANGGQPDLEAIASFASQQNQAIADYVLGA